MLPARIQTFLGERGFVAGPRPTFLGITAINALGLQFVDMTGVGNTSRAKRHDGFSHFSTANTHITDVQF